MISWLNPGGTEWFPGDLDCRLVERSDGCSWRTGLLCRLPHSRDSCSGKIFCKRYWVGRICRITSDTKVSGRKWLRENRELWDGVVCKVFSVMDGWLLKLRWWTPACVTTYTGRIDLLVLVWEPALFHISSFNVISFSTSPFWNSNSPWVIVGPRLPWRTQLRSYSALHLHVYPCASHTFLLACPAFRPATTSQKLLYMFLLLKNALTLFHGPCTLQHGDVFLRNVRNHLPSDALPNTRRP